MKTTPEFNHNIKNLCFAVLCACACLPALSARADKPGAARQAVSAPIVIRAQGHPRHVDFVARSSKRADLRANVQRIGLDAAFTEWLRAEHAHVYREHLAQLARQPQNTAADKVAAK